jgi:hypothetical protein
MTQGVLERLMALGHRVPEVERQVGACCEFEVVHLDCFDVVLGGVAEHRLVLTRLVLTRLLLMINYYHYDVD